MLWIIVLGAVGGGIYLLANAQSKKQSEPYRMALDEIQKSAKVKDKLGEPIVDASWLPSGGIDATDGSGDATFYFKISGPRGVGKAATKARMVGGKWGLLELGVTLDDGELVNAMADVKPADDGAPKFDPNQQTKKPEDEKPSPKKEIKIDLPTIPGT